MQSTIKLTEVQTALLGDLAGGVGHVGYMPVVYAGDHHYPVETLANLLLQGLVVTEGEGHIYLTPEGEALVQDRQRTEDVTSSLQQLGLNV